MVIVNTEMTGLLSFGVQTFELVANHLTEVMKEGHDKGSRNVMCRICESELRL